MAEPKPKPKTKREKRVQPVGDEDCCPFCLSDIKKHCRSECCDWLKCIESKKCGAVGPRERMVKP